MGPPILTLCSLVFAGLLSELVWRHLRSDHYGPATNPRYVVYDGVLGWKYRPNAAARHRTGAFDVEVLIGADGFRTGRTCKATSPQQRPRIVFLGDSFTFGWGLEAERAFPCLVQRALNATVSNLGVAGYGTDQEFLIFQDVALAREPDIVVLTYRKNDLHEVLAGSRYGRPKPKFLNQSGELVLSPARDRAWLLDRFSSLFLTLRHFAIQHRAQPLTASERTAGIALTKSMICRMAEQTAAAGARFVLVTESIPWIDDAFCRPGVEALQHLDVGPVLQKERKKWTAIEIENDGHWNELGHRMVADELIAVLQEG